MRCARRGHDAHVVLDEEYGEAEPVVQVAHDVHDARRVGFGEPRGRLVEQDHRRVGGKAIAISTSR